MERRGFLKTAIWGSSVALTALPLLKANANGYNTAASKLKITKIRYYSAPGYTKPLFNQARGIVEIETDGGIIGIGEGGTKDMIEQCAQMLIGQGPFPDRTYLAISLSRYVLSSRAGKIAWLGSA
jgi:hypothetical protein